MKRNFLFFIIASISLFMVSCEDRTNPEWTEQYKEVSFAVVQFYDNIPPSDSYAYHALLVPDGNGNYYMRSLKNGGTCREFFYRHYPFFSSMNCPYWILDWKWGLQLSYTNYSLPLLWMDVKAPDNTYIRSDFREIGRNVIYRYGYVKRSDIDKMLSITPAPAATTPGSWGRTSGGISTDYLAPVYLNRYYSTQDIPLVIDKKEDWKYTRQDFYDEVERQDSLQKVYIQRFDSICKMGMGEDIIRFVSK